MSQSAIYDAFDAYLLAMPGLPADGIIEGQSYNPSSGVPYVSTRMAAYSSRPAGLGPNPTLIESGIFQINVHRPTLEGRVGATWMADQVAAYFARAHCLVTADGRIVQFVSASGQPMIMSGSFLTVPVLVNWMTTTT